MQEYTSPSERLKALTDQLEQGVSDIFQSGQYAAYLTAMSKFHHYSFGNTMLIFMQCPNATNVAGYHDWRRNFGRQVKRGERGITILAPCPYRRKEEVEEAASDGSPATSVQWVQRMGFRTVTVFDVSQTEGKPLPELVKKLTDDVAQYESMVATLRSISPYPISIESFPGGAYGCCNFAEQRIFVQPDMSQAQTIKTIIHEVSHAKLHAPIEDGDGETPTQRKRRSVREMEAESVAYVVCQHFGIDTADYSFGYVAGWSHGKDLSQLKASLELIRNTAAELIDGIDPPKELPPPTQKKQRKKGEMPMSAVDARKEHYEAVEILGIPGLFTTLRVDRATIPKGVYAYDMQTSEQDWSQPCLLARHITVEHFGTVLTASPVPIPPNGYLDLSPGDFEGQFCGERMTLADFEAKWLSPVKRPPKKKVLHKAAPRRPAPIR